MGALAESILDILKQLPLSIQDAMKNKMASYVKNYERKEGDDEQKEETKKNDGDGDKNDENNEEDDEFFDLKNKMPLPEGVL